MWNLSKLSDKQDTITLRNGVKVPCIGFGTWKMPPDVAKNAVISAIHTGYRHIDTATAYCNETGVGEGVRMSGVARRELFVTTKLPNADHGYRKTIASLEGALKNLGMDYVDLYLIHWPVVEEQKDRYEEDILETWRAMLALEQEGKVRAAGVSNFMEEHLMLIQENGMQLPYVNQTQFHPQCIETGLRAYCEKEEILVEGWSPLIQGQAFEREILKRMAEKYQRSIAQICIRFALQSHVVPIPKSTNPERMKHNAEVFDFVISDEDMQEIETLTEFGRIGNAPDVPRKIQIVGF
ncbi:MAG: aldo/keto reductase [Lachnospiraceae bacterium]